MKSLPGPMKKHIGNSGHLRLILLDEEKLRADAAMIQIFLATINPSRIGSKMFSTRMSASTFRL